VIRSEKRSGSSTASREELKTILAFLRPGDTLTVTRVDRLARSIGDLQDIVRGLRAKGVTLKATEQPIDTSSAGRRTIPHAWFDRKHCARGLDCLREYKTQFDEARHVFLKTPAHDWASHGADAWRT
jgi:hypothetical protein